MLFIGLLKFNLKILFTYLFVILFKRIISLSVQFWNKHERHSNILKEIVDKEIIYLYAIVKVGKIATKLEMNTNYAGNK